MLGFRSNDFRDFFDDLKVGLAFCFLKETVRPHFEHLSSTRSLKFSSEYFTIGCSEFPHRGQISSQYSLTTDLTNFFLLIKYSYLQTNFKENLFSNILTLSMQILSGSLNQILHITIVFYFINTL